MSKCFAIVLVLVFLTASCIIAVMPVSAATALENSWASKAPMHQARTGLGVAVVNGKIYAIGGSTASGFMPSIDGPAVLGYRDLGGFVGTNEEYDPTTDTWTTKASMPTPRIVFATAVYQNKIYCIGGRNVAGSASGYYSGVNEVYDPTTNTWETKAPMPTARGWLTAGVVNGKIYLIGGSPNDTFNEVYNPATDSWATKASVPIAVGMGSVSAVVDNKIYVIGSSKLQIYDPETDKWSQGASPLSGGGYGAGMTSGVLAPKRIYVIVSKNDYIPNGVYDTETDSWMAIADLPTRRFNFGVAVVNDRLYTIGGHTYNVGRNGYVETVAVNEQYTPMGYGSIPPVVSLVSPENKTYTASNVSLTFTVNKPPVWLGYSLDGQETVTVSGNTTIAGLTSGLHNITVYAKDAFENTGNSEIIIFSIAKETETFPTTWVAAAAATIAIGSVSLAAYHTKRKNKKQKTQT